MMHLIQGDEDFLTQLQVFGLVRNRFQDCQKNPEVRGIQSQHLQQGF